MCCSTRASHAANTCSTFMTDRLACMLLAYMMFDSVTYTQNTVSTPSSGLKLARPAIAALMSGARSGRVKAAITGEIRSSGETLIPCQLLYAAEPLCHIAYLQGLPACRSC